ncbi:Kelch repeat-containing protein [Paenibacillus contaminans]|uniref:Fibronectin type-III domain-containing protein n=1 Tax=Paenibacillus contaminans TaxID=450362 RepID=A0A329MQP8_9BACL|nr:kelch repeat-containing protein [Paenibacillus contaminans]RAV22235.1 hypothetical protein DQG23_04590 [Paenibacillus contaminans]
MKSVSKFLLSLCLAIMMLSSVLAVPSLAAEDTWTTKAPILTAKSYITSAELNGKIYVFGGRTASASTPIATVEEYDPTTDTWTSKADMPTARESAGAVAINGKIYVFGGLVNGGPAINKVEAYDPITNTWTIKSPMPYAQGHFGIAEVNGKVYILGGTYSPKKVLVYDPVTDSWLTKSDIPSPREYYKATVINGKIYTIGNDNMMYDPTTDTWTSKASPPVNVLGSALTSLNGKIYLLGGYSLSRYYNELFEYDPSTDSWAPRTNMITARAYLTAVSLNGHIYAIGGHSGNSVYLNNVEVYSPPLPSQPTAPINLAATGGNVKVDLSWSAVTGSTGYNVKRSTTAGGPYTTIATGVTGTTYTDTAVTNGTTYYYVITAVNAGGESANSNEASATPNAPVNPEPTGRAILTITLVNGIEREYDLSMTEVNAFTAWYDAKADGTGPARYTLDDPHAKGPFKSRKDNIIFDKIITFDIDEYIPEN